MHRVEVLVIMEITARGNVKRFHGKRCACVQERGACPRALVFTEVHLAPAQSCRESEAPRNSAASAINDAVLLRPNGDRVPWFMHGRPPPTGSGGTNQTHSAWRVRRPRARSSSAALFPQTLLNFPRRKYSLARDNMQQHKRKDWWGKGVPR